MTEFEHLELPKANIALPKRPRPYGGGGKRSHRDAHGTQILTQLSNMIKPKDREYSPFGINPKLIFKIKLNKQWNLSEDNLTALELNLLAQEPKVMQAIVVFSSDNQLQEFQNKLEQYCGKKDGHQYGYLDAIEELFPLEPQDRIGRLLELEPLESGVLTPLDMELWHTGDREEMRQYINELDEFLKSWNEYPGMEVTDCYIGDYMCIARIKVTPEILKILLEEDSIKEIDRRPQPAFESPAQYNIPLSEFPPVPSPPLEACGVLVIDSGVQRGHPLIAPALGDADVFPDPTSQYITGGPDDGDQKTGGHGTGVSGIAIYGDVSQSLKNRIFQPKVWLFSARVTNEDNKYKSDILLENQIERAIDYFVSNYPQCKVINISLGDSKLVYQDSQKQFRLAAKIDEIAYRFQDKNILFVISAGNFDYNPISTEILRQDYPNYLLKDEARIIDPATSAIALTVGSLSMGKGASRYSDDASINAIAKVEGYPSPFTRTGLGVDEMIKPDLVDFGGDFVLDRKRCIENEPGVSILTMNKNFQGYSLFKFYIGTSFSAPRVANLAAQLFTKFPNATSNLIRALIANSAEYPKEIPNELQDENIKLRVYGNGQPDFSRSAYSNENKVVLLEDDIIDVGNFKIYTIPSLPSDFIKTRGTRYISVTLAFDPPTRHTRGDSYLGITMEFHLFKNVSAEQLKKALEKGNQDEIQENDAQSSITTLKQELGSSIEINLLPKISLRKKGTLQKGKVKIAKSNWQYDYKPLQLVVICNRKWSREEEIKFQRYALVASISHSDANVNLYNHLRLETRVTQRVRI